MGIDPVRGLSRNNLLKKVESDFIESSNGKKKKKKKKKKRKEKKRKQTST